MTAPTVSTILDLPAKALPEILLVQERVQPEAVAIEFMDRAISYTETAQQARRFASALAGLGIRRGDRVGLMAPNLPEFVFSYYGAMLAGGDRRALQRHAHSRRSPLSGARFWDEGDGGLCIARREGEKRGGRSGKSPKFDRDGGSRGVGAPLWNAARIGR